MRLLISIYLTLGIVYIVLATAFASLATLSLVRQAVLGDRWGTPFAVENLGIAMLGFAMSSLPLLAA